MPSIQVTNPLVDVDVDRVIRLGQVAAAKQRLAHVSMSSGPMALVKIGSR